MWKFKDKELARQYNKTQMAKIIGLHPITVRNVINGTQKCSKQVAYCITKFLDSNKEIEYYFERCE